MKTRTRALWLILLLLTQLLYFPINRSVQGGVILKTPLDVYLPLWGIWAIPYLLSLLWWAGSFLWAAWKMEDDLYLAFVVGTLAVMLTSYLIYLIFPTYIDRPVLDGTHWTTELVRFIYGNDRSYNAFPSGHTYTTVLIALFWSRWYPRQRWLWITITVVILFSTLFTRQHYILDLIAGSLLAWAGYRFGLWWVARRDRAVSPSGDVLH